LILAASIAALMSIADTCLLCQSVILTEDVFKRFRPSIDERRTVLLTRLSLVGLGLPALALALALNGVIASLLKKDFMSLRGARQLTGDEAIPGAYKFQVLNPKY
jgi:Na+/proline symporter